MKLLIFLFASILLLQTVSAQITAPKTCEDVLPADTCTKLREVAQLFHEKVGIVNEAIKAALDKHITKAQDVLSFVRKYLVDKANNFKCEDVLDADQCSKLTALASKFHVSVANLTRDIEEAIVTGVAKGKELYKKSVEILLSKLINLSCEDLMGADTCQKIKDFAVQVHASSQEVRKALIEAYAEGIVSAAELYAKVVEFITNDITCEQILGDKYCNQLDVIAKYFHEKAGIVDEAIRSAVAKHLTKFNEIIEFAKTYLIDRANNFKCEDVLSKDQCDKLVDVAGKFKVSVANLTRDIEEAIADGIIQGKALYQKTIEILLTKVENLSCEQLIDANTCQKINDFASKIHASSQDIQRAIIDAYSKGLVNAKEFLTDAIEYLTNEISCDKVLSPGTCSKLQSLADKFGASFDKIMEVLRESVANGITKVTDLYKAAVKYIMDKWLGLVSYRLKRSADLNEMSEVMKKAIKAALDKLLNGASALEAKVRAVIEEALLKGQIKLSQVRETIKKLIAKLTAEENAAPDAFMYRRSLRNSLKETLTDLKNKAQENLKATLEEFKAQLQRIIEELKKMLGNSVDSAVKDELVQDLELMDTITSMESNRVFSQMNDAAEKQLNDMIEDVSSEADEMFGSLVEDIKQKRGVQSWINDEIIAVLEKAINKVFGPELRTKIDTWIEAHKSIVIEAVRGGASAFLALIKSHWADILGIFG